MQLRDFVLYKMKVEDISDIIKSKSINDFAEPLGLNSDEAWDVSRHIRWIKDSGGNNRCFEFRLFP